MRKQVVLKRERVKDQVGLKRERTGCRGFEALKAALEAAAGLLSGGFEARKGLAEIREVVLKRESQWF